MGCGGSVNMSPLVGNIYFVKKGETISVNGHTGSASYGQFVYVSLYVAG